METINVPIELIEKVCKYCEDKQVYDKLGYYGDFYYKFKRMVDSKEQTKLELNEIETLTHIVRAKAVESGPFQELYKNILSKLNKMFDEEFS